MKIKKTNAMRMLEAADIPYDVKEYVVRGESTDGGEVAVEIGFTADEVFKTLVTVGDKNGVNVFCVPVGAELNLKKAAAVSGNKKVDMIALKELLPLTGYVRGGCSPIGMKKLYPTYIDETAVLFDVIAVSAGVRGAQIVLNAERLCEFIEATFADLTD